jgi:hypothetical protein
MEWRQCNLQRSTSRRIEAIHKKWIGALPYCALKATDRCPMMLLRELVDPQNTGTHSDRVILLAKGVSPMRRLPSCGIMDRMLRAGIRASQQ